MTSFGRRLDRLEAATMAGDRQPIIVWGDEPEPAEAGDRPIMRVRWMTEAEADARA
jgi:hypothetical protein